MKSIKKYLFGFLTTGLLLAGFTSCEEADYPDRHRMTDGYPTVHYVRFADQDSFTTKAEMGQVVCIVGDNLNSVHKIFFNDRQAILNTSYMTDHTILVEVPKTLPEKDTESIYLYTKDEHIIVVPFQVLPPAPVIYAIDNEWAEPGTEATITGNYFFENDANPIVVSFSGVEVKDFVVKTNEQLTFIFPEGAPEGNVTITTYSGTGRSKFYYHDTRNILFDFDGSRGGFATGLGWRAPAAGHIHNPGDDAFEAIDGSYLWLGGNGGLSGGAGVDWAEDPYSFNYWNDVEGSSFPPLSSLPTFAGYIEKYGWSGLALKFELMVPTSNPWMCQSLQLMFSSEAVVSNANPNNNFFTDMSFPRALYTPWIVPGTFDTGDKWKTVTVPLTEFIYCHDGSSCSTSFDKSYLAGFSLFLYSGPANGTDCDPVLAIDNIRVVPAQ